MIWVAAKNALYQFMLGYDHRFVKSKAMQLIIKYLLITIFCSSTFLVNGQFQRNLSNNYTKKECFENSIFRWRGSNYDVNSEDYYEEYVIFSDNMKLSAYVLKGNASYFDIWYYGFSYDLGTQRGNIQDDGGYLLGYYINPDDKSVRDMPIVGREYLECDETNAVLGDSDLSWRRRQRLSYTAYKAIYDYSKEIDYSFLGNFDILEEFVWIDLRSVCTPTLDIYDGINGNNQGYLVEDDLIEVLQDSGNWLKVRYLKTNMIYWITSGCLE